MNIKIFNDQQLFLGPQKNEPLILTGAAYYTKSANILRKPYQVYIIHVLMLFTEVADLDFPLDFFLLAVDVALPLEGDLPLVKEDLENF